MATKALVGFLFLASFTAGLENGIESYVAKSAANGITELTVSTSEELQGKIRWHSDSGDSVHINITKYAESSSELDRIEVEFRESLESLLVRVTVSTPTTEPTTNPNTASKRNPANIMALATSVLLTGIILCQGRPLKLFFVVLVVLFSCQMWLAFAEIDSTLSTKVDIHVPRNFSFKKVSLLTARGSIQVDQKLIDSETPLQCSSGKMNETCPSCCNGNGKCINGECQCGVGFRNGTTDCGKQTETTLNLFVNPLDPVIVGAKTPDGENIYMIGEKDSDGNPTNIERFQVVDSDGNSTFAQLDDNGTITSAVHSSGMSIKFTWDDNFTSVHLTLVLPDSSQQIFVKVDLTDNITNATLNIDGEEIDKRSIDEDEILIMEQEESWESQEMISNEVNVRSKRETTNAARVSINVVSCGEPESDAFVQADALIDDVSTTYTAVASDTSGLYYIYIPTAAASMIGEAVGKVCDAIEMALDKACNWYNKLNKITKIFSKHSVDKLVCFFLGNGIKLAIPQLGLRPVYKFCKAIFKGIDFYCNKINAPVISGVIETKRSELICDLITEYTDNAIDFFKDTDIYLTPFAIFPAGHTIEGPGKDLTVSPGSSIVSTTFTIDDGSTLQITSLSVVPADPDPGESYIVDVQYECYTPATYVLMTILGTDEYSNAISCNGGPLCTLHVPGAAPDVQDTVTVKIFEAYDPNGNPIVTRQAFILF